MVLGMHTFPAPGRTAPPGPDYLASPGELFTRAGTDSQTFSFIHEMQVWLAQVLLSGFLDRYPKLKMAVFESNAEWLPYMLETCDRLFKLYANERQVEGGPAAVGGLLRAVRDQLRVRRGAACSSGTGFENIGIWASDAYHHDGADSWSAMRNMREAGVPEDTQAKLLGGNARRMYGIEPKMFVTEEPAPIERPDWFPQGPELDEWADMVAHPRETPGGARAGLGLDIGQPTQIAIDRRRHAERVRDGY